MRARGFTLIELMIVVAIIAIIAAIAIPGLLRSKISTNETAAIGALKTISSSQVQFREAQAVDVDNDGSGEHAFLSELCGMAFLRIAGGLGTTKMNPASAPASLGLVSGGSVSRQGYEYRLYLPTGSGPATFEVGGPPAGNVADADAQEVRWACYAWPTQINQTGRKYFVVSDACEILACSQGTAVYNGKGAPPNAEAAYDASAAGNTNLSGGLARSANITAVDGGIWRPN